MCGCTPSDEEPPAPPNATGLVEAFRSPVGLNPEQGGIADLDRNGLLDIVVANHGSDSISLLFNHGGGQFTVLEQEGAFAGPCGIRIGDLDLDESPDVLVSSDLGDYVSVLMNSGAGSLIEESTVPAGADVCDMGLTHLDGDEYLDAVFANADDDNLSFHLNSGGLGGWELAGEFGPAATTLDIARPNTFVFEDVDGDDRPDLIIAQEDDGQVAICSSSRGDIFPTFPMADDYETGWEPEDVRAADLDGDGDLDLVVGNYASNDVAVLANDGAGGFGPARRYDSGVGTGRVALGDVDGDGDVDIVSANYQDGTLTVFGNDGAGAFERLGELESGLGPGYLEFADLDGDGDEDLLSVNFVSSDVVIFMGTSAD